MKRYRIRVPVKRASGEQIYECDAESAEEALAIYHRDDPPLECVSEEIEVEQVGDPEVEEVLSR